MKWTNDSSLASTDPLRIICERVVDTCLAAHQLTKYGCPPSWHTSIFILEGQPILVLNSDGNGIFTVLDCESIDDLRRRLVRLAMSLIIERKNLRHPRILETCIETMVPYLLMLIADEWSAPQPCETGWRKRMVISSGMVWVKPARIPKGCFWVCDEKEEPPVKKGSDVANRGVEGCGLRYIDKEIVPATEEQAQTWLRNNRWM